MKKKEKIFLSVVMCVFLALIITVFFYHDNWRDEAQAYLLCRDMNFLQIFRNVHYEGHPIFYYLLLYPFVKLGAGPKIVNIFSICFMALAVYLILFHTKLNFVQKICFLVTWPVLYEFSVVGRSYSLVFLLLIVYSIIYPRRRENPVLIGIILGLLLNTHLLIAGFVGINAFWFYGYEYFLNKDKSSFNNKKMWISFIIFLLFCILLLLQFYPILISNDGMSLNKLLSFSNVLSLMIVLVFMVSNSVNILFMSISIGIVLLLILFIFRNNKVSFWKLIVNYLYMAFFLAYIFGSVSPYMIGLSFTVLLSSVLMMDSKCFSSRRLTIYLIVASIVSVPAICLSYKTDFSHNYSSAVATAKYITKNISDDATFICTSDSYCSSLISYLPNSFYHSNSERFFTYVVWDKKREDKANLLNLDNFINNHTSLYYIYIPNDELNSSVFPYLEMNYDLKKLYITKEKMYSGEEYVIFRIDKR